VNAATLALRRAEVRLLERLDQLEARLDHGDGDGELWRAYADAAGALAMIARETAPGAHGELLSTREMAARLGVSAKTILRRRKAGQLTPAAAFGQRGRAALRWQA
jgi:hypothetical protein